MAGDGDAGSDSDDPIIELEGESNVDDDLLLEDPPQERPERASQKEPHMFWIRWICRRPKTMFAITTSLHVIVVIVSLVLYLTGYDVIHLVVKSFPIYDMNDVMYTRFLAWTRKDPKGMFYIRVQDLYPKKRKRRSLHDDLNLDHMDFARRNQDENDFFKHVKARQFSPAYIDESTGGYQDVMLSDAIRQHYSPFDIYRRAASGSTSAHLPFVMNQSNSRSHSTHARMKRSGTSKCGQWWWFSQSFDLIYDTDAEVDNILIPRYLKTIQNFETQLTKEFYDKMYGSSRICMYQNPQKGSVLDVFENDLIHIRNDVTSDFFLAKSGSIDPATRLPKSTITRSYFTVRTNATTFKPILAWGHDFLKRADELSNRILKPKGITLSYFSFNVYTDTIFRTILGSDIFLFCGSVLFIFSFMWLQTGSFWITFFGISSILTSILAANLVYNCIIGFKYLGIFNLMSLFIVLGIGADDIFIFVDTWKWLDGKCDQQEERISMCFKKAGVAMFDTSLTTMVAFFVSSFSSLLSLCSFGTLAGLVVLINYISVMAFFPTVILAHESLFGKSRLALSRDCTKGIHKYILKFFGGIYFDVITHRYGRFVIIAAFAILTGGMSLSLADLRVQDSATSQILRSNSPFEQGRIKASTEFKQNAYDLKMDVFLVWGFKPRDMSTCNKLRYDYLKPCPGEEAMDDQFRLESPRSQMALLDVCRSLRNASSSMIDELGLSENRSTRVYCVMEAFDMYLRVLSSPLMTNLTLPLTKEKLQPVLPMLKLVSGLDIDIDKVTTPFQTLLWIFVEKTSYGGQLDQLVGFKNLTDKEKNETVGTYNGKPLYNRHLRYMGVMVPTSKAIMAIGIDEGIKLMTNWETYMEEKVSILPDGLKGGFQVAENWFLLNLKRRLVLNAVTGVGVSLALAFTLLLVTTRNIILAVISLVTLSATVVCVIGLMPLMGWELDPLVALNMCFVAGLAVDYIVHVIEGFQLSDFQTRHDRIQECLRHVGISVISGAVTTLGSSFFMLFAQVNFFMQFGTFIFCTIGISLLFSLFFLPALLSVVGPSGGQGSLMVWCRRRREVLGRSYISL